MKNNFLICLSLATCFLLLLNQANAGNKIEPRQNPNLSPFDRWWSAYYCMQNGTEAGKCSSKVNHTLTMDGWIKVLDSDINEYCNGGCYEHTLWVFQCIQDVKKDFKFQSNAPLDFVRNATAKACINLQGFSTSYTENSSATN